MEFSTYLDTLDDLTASFVATIRGGDPTTPVPTCGDWTLADLATHVGKVWTIATTNVAAQTTEPTRPEPDTAPPDDPTGLADWLDARRQAMSDTLGHADPASLAWSFAANNQTAGFWIRRMVHETTVHRFDAEHALGDPTPLDPTLASDGIDEYTQVGLRYSSGRPNREYPSSSLHLHCTDVEGEWTMVGTDGPDFTVTREHAKGDAAVRGPAADLLLWIWGRPGGPVEIFGDEGVATTWRALAP